MTRVLPHIFLAVMLFVVYADLIATSNPSVLSGDGLDADEYFEVTRSFGFSQLRAGNFPLWNPYVFGGVPYHAGFQSALLYPPNLLYFLLPTDRALDIDLLMHLYLMGLGVVGWTRRFAPHPAGAAVAGATVMLCGPFFLHVFPGHVTLIATFAWAPYLMWAIDCVLERPTVKAVTGGVLAVTMMLLAGFPQAAYMCALASAFWLLLSIGRLRENCAPKLVSLAAIACVPVAIAAGQILPGLEFAQESIRSGGLTRTGALGFSLHPWDLAEILFPNIYSGSNVDDYWGGRSSWESSVFFGRLGLIALLYGLLVAPVNGRRPLIAVSIVSVLIALGPHSPVAPALYAWVPGFDNFRAVGRYALIAVLFAAPLLAAGVSAILTSAKRNRTLAISTGVLASACWALYAIVRWAGGDGTETGAWESWLRATAYIGETSTLPLGQIRAIAIDRLSKSILTGAIMLTAAALLCLARSRTPWASRALVALACIEMVAFARANRPETDPSERLDSVIAEYQISKERGMRVMDLDAGNRVMKAGAYNVLGYDPARIRRYLELVAASQQAPPVSISEDESSIQISRFHPILSLLRCAFIHNPDATDVVTVAAAAYPRFLVVPNYEVVAERDTILRRLRQASFNGRETVLLEQNPQGSWTPPAGQITRNVIRVEAESTNYTDLDVDAPAGGVLLCTDAYSQGWHATPLTGSVQDDYELIPANWALRAIPLQPGHHRIRMEYRPRSFDIGMGISITAVMAACCTIATLLAIRLQRGRTAQGSVIRGSS